MAKYKAYPEYKDSGVEWVDSIPSHWEVRPTFSLCEASAKKNIDGAENNVLSLSYGNIIPRNVEENFGLLPESFNTYQIIERGDVILRLTDLQNDKNSLRVGLVKQKGIITSAYLKLKAKNDMNSAFLYRLLHSYDTTKVFYGMGGGLRQSMKFEDFRRLPLLLPPKEEQLNISAFLDHETAKIDNLIEKQQQLIELMKEKRQAVISHAVTKGLNPDVPMKDSGVEWLGEVPEHWKVSSLGYYSSLNTGATPDRSNSKYWNGEIAWIKTGEVNYNNICSSEEKITCEAVKNTSVRLSPPGTLLMAMYGQGITRGRVAILDISATYNQACVAISPNEALLNVYLRLFFMAGYHAIRDGGNETSQMNLNADIVRKFKILVPPLSEQKEIVSYLDCHLPQIEILVERADSVIALLQERRTALISAAVTGKIDVRDWVMPASSEMADIEESQGVNA
ncbi:restriction endonuclease subunit S [Pectobacterium versatile]|uniref:restriction endonuclease subunit S n=1 Tax=Pectobacterium versatile TaxID=2488639 RepID=UPI001CCF4A24|nr:restriction endonuclease subunit S [Pectobacterium versatile]